jgi:hypothetical protein
MRAKPDLILARSPEPPGPHVLGDDGRTLRGQGQHRALFGLTFTRAER